MKTIDLMGQTFGKLTVIGPAENYKFGGKQWLCHCACGNFIVVRSGKLRSGNTRSCGCLRKDMFRKAPSNSKTGIRYIYYIPSRKDYRVSIKGRYIMSSPDINVCIAARNEALKSYYGNDIRDAAEN